MLSAKLPAFSGGQSTIVFATTNGTGKVADADTKAAIETALTKLRAVPHVASVVDPFQGRLVSQSGTVALGQVQWSAKAAEVKDANLTAVKEAMKPVQTDGVQVEYNGSVYPGWRQPVSELPELVGLIIAFAILMITFGAFAAAGMPILDAIIGVVTTLMGITALASVVSIASASTTVALMLGLSCGIVGQAVQRATDLPARRGRPGVHPADLRLPNHRGADQVDPGLPALDDRRDRRTGRHVPVGLGLARFRHHPVADDQLPADHHARDHLRSLQRLRGIRCLPDQGGIHHQRRRPPRRATGRRAVRAGRHRSGDDHVLNLRGLHVHQRPDYQSNRLQLRGRRFLDAFVVRLTLVPAVMALAGKRIWYHPAWFAKHIPDPDIEGQRLEHQLADEELAAMTISQDLNGVDVRVQASRR